MKTLGLGAVLLVTVCALVRAAAVAPAGNQFTTAFVLTAMEDGKRIVVAEPTLVTDEGQEGEFFSGEDAPVDKDGKESLPFGITARIKVYQETHDRLRVSMYASQSDLDMRAPSSFLIRERGVHCVRTVKPGEKVEIDLGEGRTAAFTVSLTAKR